MGLVPRLCHVPVGSGMMHRALLCSHEDEGRSGKDWGSAGVCRGSAASQTVSREPRRRSRAYL